MDREGENNFGFIPILFVCLFVLFRECNCLRRQELLLLLCGTQVLFGSIFLLLALIFSAFVISCMDIPSSKEAFTPGECNSFFWQRGSKVCSARFEDSILPFFNLFCLLDFFFCFLLPDLLSSILSCTSVTSFLC